MMQLMLPESSWPKATFMEMDRRMAVAAVNQNIAFIVDNNDVAGGDVC